MMRKWVLLSCVLFLGSAGNSEATPLDPPDIVYVDGLPCNSLCQSYMAWSRQSLSIQAQRAAGQPPQVLPKALVHREIAIRGQRAKPAAHARVVRQGAANSRNAAREAGGSRCRFQTHASKERGSAARGQRRQHFRTCANKDRGFASHG